MCCLHKLVSVLMHWSRKTAPYGSGNDLEVNSNTKLQLNGKKGVGYTLRGIGKNGDWVEHLLKILELKVSWHYSWGSRSLQDLQPTSIEFLPMIWGYYGNEEALREEVRQVQELQHPPFLLAFNEPDNKNQSNLSVERVLDIWHILESVSIPLVSPSCVNPLGDWMKEFMKECASRNYRVDIVGVHNYGGTNPKSFQATMETVYKMYQKPIIVTEFAPADWHAKTTEENCHNPQEVLEFMKVVLPWLESQSWIIGYAWFPFSVDSPAGCCSALYGKDGKLTECGQFYSQFRSSSGY